MGIPMFVSFTEFVPTVARISLDEHRILICTEIGRFHVHPRCCTVSYVRSWLNLENSKLRIALCGS